MLNSKAVCRFHLKNVCNGEFPSQVNLMTGVVPMFASAILGIANGANIMIITHAERVVAVWASPDGADDRVCYTITDQTVLKLSCDP
jgi:hypothetical protein